MGLDLPRASSSFTSIGARVQLLSIDFSFMRILYFLNGARYGSQRESRSRIVGVNRNRVPDRGTVTHLTLPSLSSHQPFPRSRRILESPSKGSTFPRTIPWLNREIITPPPTIVANACLGIGIPTIRREEFRSRFGAEKFPRCNSLAV